MPFIKEQTVTDQEMKHETTIIPQRDADTKKTALTEEQLGQISGGADGKPVHKPWAGNKQF